jgi:hypothetical protein
MQCRRPYDDEDINSTGLFAVRAPVPSWLSALKVKAYSVNELWCQPQFLAEAYRAKSKFRGDHAFETDFD